MKHGGEQKIFHDETLHERSFGVSEQKKTQKLHIDHGNTIPSPYIVKLSRASASSVTDEIQALAQSLIIDGDDDERESSQHFSDDSHEYDISAQLQEFDRIALPPGAVSSISRESRQLNPAPSSLDAALETLVEPPISLEAFVPIESVVLDASGNEAAEQISSEASSPWVVGEFRAEHQEKKGNSFLRFEAAFWKGAGVRAVGAFMALSFVVVLPLHAMQAFSGSVQRVTDVQDSGVAALHDIADATAAFSSQHFNAAETKFSSAAEKFSYAQESLDAMHAGVVALVNVIPQTNRTYETVRGLVTAGQELSDVASIMSKAGEELSTTRAMSLTAKLSILAAYLESATPHVERAHAALANVDVDVVPSDYTQDIAELQARVPAMAEALEECSTFVHTLTYLLGGNDTMRYLAVFQNNTELRPTGGFVGSFAEMDLDEGEIARLHLPGGGSYDVQGQLDAFVASPRPLALINPRWEFQDANWFPDFPTSAKKMQWFYEHAGGPTTDGVLAVNATWIEALLEVTGPIAMPEYGVTIDAENFLFTTEKIVEVDHGTTATPKAFLGDLAPKLLDVLQHADGKTLLRVIGVVEQGLAERDIQVYFRNNDAEKLMHDLGFDGAIAQTEGDYLMVVNTNIGGGKTDAVIDQSVDVQVDVSDDGAIIDTVTITKTHHGMANALFTGKNNVDYVRLYVPEGAVLLSAEGFETPPSKLFESSDFPLSADEDLAIVERDRTYDGIAEVDIWNEFGKTVFGGWMQTAPGETETITFSYRIPRVLFSSDAPSFLGSVRSTLGFAEHDRYSLFVQKQSGVITRATTVHFGTPEAWKTLWTNVTEEDDRVARTSNTRDAFFGWVLTR